MQHFLGCLGITHSYLYLNTFVYPIFDQYTPELRWLAQDPESPIVQHRHQLLQYVAETNPGLALVISVGTAAKESVATWKRMRSGELPARVRSVHVLHPGAAAAEEGQAAAVRASFARAFKQILAWAGDAPKWLPVDEGGARLDASAYRFSDAPIPFRNLPFGMAWRIGRGGTSSNRRDGQRAIQIFSSSGEYNNQGHALSYATSAAHGSPEGYEQDAGDRPYEPPRHEPEQFDPGPGAALARLLMGGDTHDWPDFEKLKLPAHPSFGFGPTYRGRFARATLLAFVDQESHDDLFTGRAATGEGGQLLQSFLSACGWTGRYVIVRPIPVDSLSASQSAVDATLRDPKLVTMHSAILERLDKVRVVLAVGPQAAVLAKAVVPSGLTLIALKSARADGWLPDWQAAFAKLKGLEVKRDRDPAASFPGARGQIARIDLPFGTLRWWGSSGSRALQAKLQGKASRDYFKYVMPAWAAKL